MKQITNWKIVLKWSREVNFVLKFAKEIVVCLRVAHHHIRYIKQR